MTASRDINSLDPRFLPFVLEFQESATKAGLDVLIYCCYRPNADQDVLFAQGRTAPGHIVTNARAGQSAHNYRLAFDGCPVLAGKPMWNEPLIGPHWDLYGKIATDCGMEWGGHWAGHLVEGPHVQMANWKQVAGVA